MPGIDIATPGQVRGCCFQVCLADMPEKLGLLSAKVNRVDIIFAAYPKEDPHNKKVMSRSYSSTL
jgi:hypothetical protein